MRRSHSGGYAYEPVPSTSAASLEDENERITDELRDKIHALKSLSIDIGAEVKYQDKMLNEMDDDFERTRGSLSSSISRVLRLSKGGHNCYIIYIFLFSIAVFFVLWLVLKLK
ncbi:BET1 homolog [Leptopilina boulardi]|uniref:BET1 homolog n=1 Tax=Leptopilina boulardi TaxID=63433 RepID=UPI0021F5A0DD|nr:BET1 homolog [Leptopilina boulardi]